MRPQNHASRFEGIAKTNLQGSRTSDPETLQSQIRKSAENRLPLNGLEIVHGRLVPDYDALHMPSADKRAAYALEHIAFRVARIEQSLARIAAAIESLAPKA